MKCLGINVDERAIAEGLVDMIDDLPDPDSYRSAMRLGMTPAPLMRFLEVSLRQKFDAIAMEQVGTTPEQFDEFNRQMLAICGETPLKINEAKRNKFVVEVSKAVHLEMLSLGGCLV